MVKGALRQSLGQTRTPTPRALRLGCMLKEEPPGPGEDEVALECRNAFKLGSEKV